MKRFWLLVAIMVTVVCAVAQAAAAEDLRVYFGNLHSHTKYSDGQGTPREAYEHARDEAGLDFLAITDHNHWPRSSGDISVNHDLYSGDGPNSIMSAARSYTENGSFVAIYGQEFSSTKTGNHANVFEVDEVIDTSDVPNGAWGKLLDEWLPAHRASKSLRPPNTTSYAARTGVPSLGWGIRPSGREGR